MRIKVKTLGIINLFNDIQQTKHYVKISCEKYLYKMLKGHDWLSTDNLPDKPTPLPSDTAYIQTLENAKLPETYGEQQSLKSKMGFNYRQVIWEIIYPMMKCCPDIGFHATKLSQYMDNPAESHYTALKNLCQYLATTIHDGIYYWRDQP